MCGLVGIYSSNLFTKHKDCLSHLLYFDTLRGRDSTGVSAIRSNSETSTLKMVIPGHEFVELKRFEEHLKLNDFCWIGHNRYGTMGKNIKANAHPFEILDEDGACLLVGAHNGTLKNKHALDNHNQFGTDSEALFDQIANKGLEDTIPLIEGAWALVWFDHVHEELRFLRNKERTLYYAFEEGKKTLIWASEMWMIRVAAMKCNIKLEGDQVWSFAEDTLYRFPAPVKCNDTLDFERKGGLVGKTVGFFRTNEWKEGWSGGNHGQRTQQKTETETRSQIQTGSSSAALAVATAGASSSQSSTQTQSNGEKPQEKNEGSSSAQAKSEGQDKVTNIETAKKYKGYGGILYSKKTIQNHLDNGCGWCEEEFISLDDKYGWLAKGKPICQKCLEGEDISEEDDDKVTGVTVH